MNLSSRRCGAGSRSGEPTTWRGNDGRGFILRDRLSRPVRSRLFIGIAAALALAAGACGDGEAISPKPVGFSYITMMNAGFATEGELEFRRDTARLGRLSYGGIDSALVPNLSTIVTVRSADGSQLATASVQPDSTVSAWVIFSGTAQQRDAYQVRSTKIVPALCAARPRMGHPARSARLTMWPPK